MKRVQYRAGTASEFTTKNPVLAKGEIGLESDTGRQKIGDGSTRWSVLSYLPQETGTGGVVITASNGSRFQVTVDVDGSLVTTAL